MCLGAAVFVEKTVDYVDQITESCAIGSELLCVAGWRGCSKVYELSRL